MGWFSNTTKKQDKNVIQDVVSGLQKLYAKNLRPLEDAYKFHEFHSPPLDDADFHAKPMVLLIGQYSTGKTTFIKYLLEEEFPGMRIGPEPTTDGFIAIMQGDVEATGKRRRGVIPGNALVVDRSKPFRGLTSFGNNFLSRLQCSQMDNGVLDSLSIIDTPGILSGEKQRVDRGYDFCKVLTWFAERVDRIILLFDAHKLDISDEFHAALRAIKGFDDKIRVVLNKSDQVNTQQLMRVYGALMWSLGKVITTPEVPRVYIGSFWNEPLLHNENRKLFEQEARDLFEDLQTLPRNCALRKLNDLIKRARLAKVHAFIIAHMADNMPAMFGKDKAKKKLMDSLPDIYAEISRKYSISMGDFPSVDKMRENLERADWSKFGNLKVALLQKTDQMLARDVPTMMKMIQADEAKKQTGEPSIIGGVMENLKDNPFGAMTINPEFITKHTPFYNGYGEGVYDGVDEDDWVVRKQKEDKFDGIFMSLGPTNGKISGNAAKKEMMKSSLPNTVLGKIWKLSDCDKDGFLDAEEFSLAMHLIQLKTDGHELPSKLPQHLIPPGHRSGDV